MELSGFGESTGKMYVMTMASCKNHLLVIFLFALLANGCSQEEVLRNRTSASGGRVFTTSFEKNESRTYLEDGSLSRWTESDRISLFDASTLNSQYVFAGETGDSGGSFFMLSKPEGTGTTLAANYAVYPYSEDVAMTKEGEIVITLPSEQHYAENSYGLGDNTMVAVTEDTDDTFLSFKNVGGAFKLQLYGEDVTVKSITLKGNNGEKIAGKATITAVYDQAPVVAMADDATTSITLDCGEQGVKIGSSADEATAFWMVVPPTTFSKGITIIVKDTENKMFTQTTDKEVVIERNVVKPMTAVKAVVEKKFKSTDFIIEQNKDGWNESMYFVNGSQIHLKKDETTGKLSNMFAWAVDNKDQIHPIMAEMNEDGMPSKITYGNLDFVISRYDNATLDIAMFMGDELIFYADSVVHNLNITKDSRAWKDNNGIRNTVAVVGLGLSVAEIILSGAEIGASVVSQQYWAAGLGAVGLASGIADFKESYDLLFNSPEATNEDWNSVIRELSNNSIDIGKELKDKNSKLYKMIAERKALKDLNLKLSDIKPKGLVSLMLSLLDKFFGESYNSIDQILEFIESVSVTTNPPTKVTASSAQVSAFYSYTDKGGVTNINMKYGMRYYKSEEPNVIWDLWNADWNNGHEYKFNLENLEEYTKYSYQGFYHETEHDWYFFGNEWDFRTKELDDLREALVKLYQSTNGDNWTHNDNWLDFNKPLTEWYGITKQGENQYTLTFENNNLTGKIEQTFPEDVSIKLLCSSNQLTSIDLSKCTTLTMLDCSKNQLTSLDVSGCSALTGLNFSNNLLTSLKVSGCTKLKELNCNYNQLTSLDVSKCTALKELNCILNQLTTLNVSECTALTKLVCAGNQFTSLDVSECTALTELNCNSSYQLTSLDISKCTALTYLDCSYSPQLASLKATGHKTLKTLYCANNSNLTSLDVSGCTELTLLSCYRSSLTSLNVSGCTSLTDLSTDNQLVSLNASNCKSLKRLLCTDEQLTTLNVTGCTALKKLNCKGNQLTTLNITSCKSLTDLDCYNNQLTTLNIMSCKSLATLDCGKNQLTTLNVSGHTALTFLDCSYSDNLTSINASSCTALKTLNISKSSVNSLDISGCTSMESFATPYSNQLNSLNVLGCTALKTLNVSKNQLSSLNVSNLTSLTTLVCSSNPLRTLNATGCTALKELNCGWCQLNSLNVSGCVALRELFCIDNQLSVINVSTCKSLTFLNCENNQITAEIPEWFSQFNFIHDERYRYWQEEVNGVYVTKHEDRGIGWWYPGEPEKGKHSPD